MGTTLLNESLCVHAHLPFPIEDNQLLTEACSKHWSEDKV